MPPQQQTFTNVTPIPQKQTFSNVTPISGQDQPGFLDKEIPLDSYTHATDSGLQSIGRGVRGAIAGGWNVLKTAADAWNDPKADVGDAMFPDPHLEQVPGAIRDINASPDPLGTYAKAAQETAGQGAGQALTSLAAEGAGRVPAGKLYESAKAIGAPAADAVSKLPVIDKVVEAGRAIGKYKNVPGQLADIWGSKPTYPGAPLPETPDPALGKASSLLYGPKEVQDPAAGLGQIPVRSPGQAGSIADSMSQTSAPQRGSLRQMVNDVGDQVGKGLGASPPPSPKEPIYQRGNLSSQMQGGDSDLPQGHTAVQSSALKSYRYIPESNELHAQYGSGNGTVHVFGDVSPEEAQQFEQAKSKGQAMQQIKNGHPLVAKIINGKRQAVTPTQ